ncbi:hypothetical protein ABT324_30880 [Saccharopolyspora sp. NPDC000359]|uniref:hypothetical protein n=1 Tax=Saccharopolyspora sp. NPDC000359 TaxID=3154251 RepID=UPI003330966B
MINEEQPVALHAALADVRRALAGRPAEAAPQITRPGPARGLVIDPYGSTELELRDHSLLPDAAEQDR